MFNISPPPRGRLAALVLPKPPWGEGLLHEVASLSASKPAGGGLDAQAAEATAARRGVGAIAKVPDAGAAPPVELPQGPRSPAEAAGAAPRNALLLSSKVSGSVSPFAARCVIVKPLRLTVSLVEA